MHLPDSGVPSSEELHIAIPQFVEKVLGFVNHVLKTIEEKGKRVGNKCRRCGSYAINPHCHGREAGKHLTLCDVCYWREQYDNLKMNIDLLTKSDKTFNED